MVQLNYSMLNRTAEQQLLPWCRQHSIATIIRGPLAQGVATGKFDERTTFTDSVRQKWNQAPGREGFLRSVRMVEKLRFLEQPQRSMAQAALQYVIAHPAVTTAIPGAKSVEQVRANAAAGDAPLASEQVERVRELTA